MRKRGQHERVGAARPIASRKVSGAPQKYCSNAIHRGRELGKRGHARRGYHAAATREKRPSTTKDTKYREGFYFDVFPSCTFVPFVVRELGFTRTTDQSSNGLNAVDRIVFSACRRRDSSSPIIAFALASGCSRSRLEFLFVLTFPPGHRPQASRPGQQKQESRCWASLFRTGPTL